jgi:hypothetical protein
MSDERRSPLRQAYLARGDLYEIRSEIEAIQAKHSGAAGAAAELPSVTGAPDSDFTQAVAPSIDRSGAGKLYNCPECRKSLTI